MAEMMNKTLPECVVPLSIPKRILDTTIVTSLRTPLKLDQTSTNMGKTMNSLRTLR